MKLISYGLALGVILLSGCNQPEENESAGRGGGGSIKAVNHTKWAINHFSVNGQSGIDIIGPWQGGGGGCCYGAPAKWMPGMTVKVDWEAGVAFASDIPEIPEPKRPDARASHQEWQVYYDKKQEWFKKIKALSEFHSRTVRVPDYTGQDTCGITVHFLPCDQVKVTTNCYAYGSPEYPIKEPLKMEASEICPK